MKYHVYNNPAFVMWCWQPSNYGYWTMRSWQHFWLLVLIVSVLAGRHHCMQDFNFLAHLLWVIGQMDLWSVSKGLFLHCSRYAWQKSLGCWCYLKYFAKMLQRRFFLFLFFPLALVSRTDFPIHDVLGYSTCIHFVITGNACSSAEMYKCVFHSITSKAEGARKSEEKFKQKQIR